MAGRDDDACEPTPDNARAATRLGEPDGLTVVSTEASSRDRGIGPRPRDGEVEPGDLLNGIYRVDQFLARGGMGDVYVGVNVETDDRVAIKAIRRHLARDPNVAALFRKEARVLTQLSHPAIVPYRVLAREPTLDLLYIVTDLVEGQPLSAKLDGTRPTLTQVLQLARRLASGLSAAHQLGVVHRDVSPDNILLPDDSLERAKIIDFGISKSVGFGGETIIGTGFAGKLAYVAPEQFGEHDSEIGPWTDVYSTALVLRAFAAGRSSELGATLAEAVERRRSVPSLNEVPPELRPLLGRMLAPAPATRLRSMSEVLTALDALEGVPPAVRVSTAAPSAPAAPGSNDRARDGKTGPFPSQRRGAGRRKLLAGIGATTILAAVAAVLVPRSPSPNTVTSAPHPRAPIQRAAAVTPAEPSLQTALASLPCAWVTAGEPHTGDAIRLGGAAGDPVAVQGQVQSALASSEPRPSGIDASAVLAMPPAGCGVAAAARPFAASLHGNAETLHSTAAILSLAARTPGCPPDPLARIDLEWSQAGRREFALLAMLSSGEIVQVAGGRDEFARETRARPRFFRSSDKDEFGVSLCLSQPGPIGFLLVQSQEPVDLGLTTGRPVEPARYFYDRLGQQAAQRHWLTQATWLRIDGAVTQPAANAEATPTVATAEASVGKKPMRVAEVHAGTKQDAKPNTSDAISVQPDAAARSVTPAVVCRRFSGGHWRSVGELALDGCVARIFAEDCDATYGMFGSVLMRRYNGSIERQEGARWTSLKAEPRCRRGLGGLFRALGGSRDHRKES